MNNYKDMLGNELKVKFSVGGFDNDITCCSLYKQTMIFPGIKFLGMKPRYAWKEVYQGVTSDNLAKVSTWLEEDYHLLVVKCINVYNEKTVSRMKVKSMTQKLNQL